MSTKFFTNSNEKSLFQKFTGIINNMKDLYAFHAVVGYFRSSGYFALQPYLKNIPKIRILVGINVDQAFADAQKRGMMYFGDEEKSKKEFLDWFITDVKEAKYSKDVEAGILEFIEDLINGKIEIRAHHSHTLHAKFYLFLPENHNPDTDGWVIMGSSNLTDAGLGIKKTPNYELNIALKDYDDVNYTNQEFDRLWLESTTILPADLQGVKHKTHIGQNFTPYELYIKFLIEYFGKNIDYDPDTVGDLPKTFKKLSYQIDAVNQGFQMLMEHNGFFLADVVGLGKTVIATIIAKRFLIANGSLNTKILVVYPPALEKNWKTTFKHFGIDRHTKFITNGRLEKILDGDLNYWAKEEYDLILVDESHRYRNHKSSMFDALQRICKSPRTGEGIVKGDKKKVILISATPLNNRPSDLYHQVLLFQDSRRSTLPQTNLQSFFGPIIREYKEIIREEKPDLNRIRELYKEIREKVIQPITVRRTRKDLRNYPQYLDDIKAQGIIFPEIAAPREQIYVMDAKLSKLFYHTIFYLSDDDKINYYRYQAIRFLNEDLQTEYYEQAILVSKSLASIMKTLMVKRLESSFEAFKTSLGNMLKATERMIDMFSKQKIFIAPDNDVNLLMDKGWSDEEIEEEINRLGEENPRNRVFEPSDFSEEFLIGLKKDQELIKELYNSWTKVLVDPKLDCFLKLYKEELIRPDLNPTGKLVVFTESKDTADYLNLKLSEAIDAKILNVSSKNRNQIFETIQENFDANYPGVQKNDYNVIISTDVLAEGINLHRSNIIVNYDTPWNASRLMQRVGRVNRIGSTAGVIYTYNFYPSQQGDEEIKLYNNALVKLQSFHSAFGEDTKIFTHEELIETFKLFEEGMPDDEDKRLKYLKFIREFKDENPKEFKRIKGLPIKARTGRSANDSNKKILNKRSIIFLKSVYKTEFYLIDETNSVYPLTFLDAVNIFEAEPNEKSYPLPENHYTQIQSGLDKFEKEFLVQSDNSVLITEKSDGISAQAKKFLRDFKVLSKNDKVKECTIELLNWVEKGTYTQLPNELRKLKQQLEKKQITYAQTEVLLNSLASKYRTENLNDDENDTTKSAAEFLKDIQPEIVITESFIE